MDVKTARKEAIKQKYAKIASEMKAAQKRMKLVGWVSSNSSGEIRQRVGNAS